MLKSSGSAWTRNATSTFAARICSRVACQTSLREIDVRRGRSASISPVVVSSPTQSPTPGRSSSRTKPVRGARAHVTRLGREVVGAPVLDRDAGGHEPGGAVLGERGFPAVVPPKPLKQRFRDRKCQPKLLCMRDMNGRIARSACVRRRCDGRGRRARSSRERQSSCVAHLLVVVGTGRTIHWPRPRRGEVPNRVRSGRKQP